MHEALDSLKVGEKEGKREEGKKISGSSEWLLGHRYVCVYPSFNWHLTSIRNRKKMEMNESYWFRSSYVAGRQALLYSKAETRELQVQNQPGIHSKTLLKIIKARDVAWWDNA